MDSSPEWKKPSDVMRLVRRRSGAGASLNSAVRSPVGVGTSPHDRAGSCQDIAVSSLLRKRKNPFECAPLRTHRLYPLDIHSEGQKGAMEGNGEDLRLALSKVDMDNEDAEKSGKKRRGDERERGLEKSDRVNCTLFQRLDTLSMNTSTVESHYHLV